jgi:hypothetical protein
MIGNKNPSLGIGINDEFSKWAYAQLDQSHKSQKVGSE